MKSIINLYLELLPVIEEITVGKAHGNYIEIFRQARQSLSIKKSKCLWTHNKDGVTREFLFWLIKTAVPVEISRYSFRVTILQRSLQFLVGVFTFLSLILQSSFDLFKTWHSMTLLLFWKQQDMYFMINVISSEMGSIQLPKDNWLATWVRSSRSDYILSYIIW